MDERASNITAVEIAAVATKGNNNIVGKTIPCVAGSHGRARDIAGWAAPSEPHRVGMVIGSVLDITVPVQHRGAGFTSQQFSPLKAAWRVY